MKRVELNKKGFEKLQKRQVWIYNKEIEHSIDSIKEGELVSICYKNRPVAVGFFNPKSKIKLRIIDFSENIDIEKFIKIKMLDSIKRRSFLKNITNSFRLFHSDADGLSGLVIDKYGDNIICSFDTAGVDKLKTTIVKLLIEELNPKGIYEKANDIRKKEGLNIKNQTIFGQIDNEFLVEENGFKFLARLKEGQKTGFYLDQRKNREIIGSLKSTKVLDLFSHSGGFGIYTKANFVKFVEISNKNCELISKNTNMNRLKNYEIVKKDAFDFLAKDQDTYDLIVIDPPAFAKNRFSKRGATKGYKYLISNSIDKLTKYGYLAIFSCSHIFGLNDILNLCLSVSIEKSIKIEVINFLKQDIDHPYIISIPTSLYLTGVLIRKLN